MKIKLLTRCIATAGVSSALILPTVNAAVLEEVMVTAQKRAQSVNDVGVSANAFAGDALKELGVDQASDLGAFTPGLVTVNATSGSTPIFAIRGIGLDDFNSNNSSGVGVYTDEVFASSPVYLSGQIFDIERVEVLKGPQGTLYGKNTTGGAINFITNKPSDELEGDIEVGYGSHDTVELTGVISGPLTEGVRGRLSANYVKGDGWQEDKVTGEEFGEQDRKAIRGQLAFDIGDNGDALLRAYYSEDQSKPSSPHGEKTAEILGLPGFDSLDSPTKAKYVAVGSRDVQRDEEGSGVAFTFNYSFEAFDFVSISSFDQYDRLLVDNYDGTAAASMDTLFDGEFEQWSQEFRLVGNSDGGFSWITGVNVSAEKVEDNNQFDTSIFVTDAVYYGSFDSTVYDSDIDVLDSKYTQETDSWGVYVHTETELTDSVSLIAGARYSYDDRSFEGNATEIFFGTVYPVIDNFKASEDESAVTGKLGLDWQASDDLLVFTNVATSYKGGVYYSAGVLDSDAWGYVDPEEILSYELGFKWSLLEGSMQLNGSMFKMEYQDRQSLVTYIADDFSNYVAAYGTIDATLVNVPESETQGFELDVNWLPTDELSVQLGVAYLDTEITKAPTTADLRGINADPTVNAHATGDSDFSGVIDGSEVAFVDALAGPTETGTALAQAPEWSYNATVAYETPVANDLVLRLQTSYSWVDSQFSQLSDPNAEYDATKALNTQLSLGHVDGDWLVTLWGRNITNEQSETYAFTGTAARTVYKQQPATYGVSFNYRFW
ncbi:TonB-dependent receptor [Dasania sp. GY-MA-18]|uniref:TonB-dependent receptor n=1 Tax=Dasania phycosphaerae TaxID=2950436 RepID=A0A9J6RSS0_9GAMM|nr:MULTISPECIES: TonB-dependent receptor [Dasania]MCR8924458.1 TonB-dependent receptor [Dasania sp. GY-MA-18]MCZ0867133.1 TonB-dependent receptor [Dasania phycosphaerae]MCZ0870585.1 TonB-dependent receptor [Dasania phycosphaerae]